MRRSLLLAVALALLASTAMAVPITAAATPPAVQITAPATAHKGVLTAVSVTLPANVAAVDGRVLFAPGTISVVGLAIGRAGTGLRPVAFKGGASFGAYALHADDGAVRLQLILEPRRTGRLSVRVVIDSMSSRTGNRIDLGQVDGLAVVPVAGSSRRMAAPAIATRIAPSAVAQSPRELVEDGRFTARDLDTARLEWSSARERGAVCASPRSDVNADGCTDIVDVQATLASQGRATSFVRPAVVRPRASVGGGRTFTVTSTADAGDAVPGNGLCEDGQGRCTLRAAMTEADYLQGDDRIEFNLQGTAPVTIQLASRLPIITSRLGTLVIDGYSQPGASVNTADFGTNAVPGVELRGNGTSAREVGLRITSDANTIRGLTFSNLWRGILLDGAGAHDNRIVGNWIGFTRTGSNSGSQYGMVINVGATHNLVGTPALADRNVIGNWGAGIDLYGPGVDGNVIQNNLFCIRPSGGTATCSTAIDHNFGPKSQIIGGDDPFERNVVGPTSLQGIEFSHGWDQSVGRDQTVGTTYQINDNRVTGNWVGFRADGSYDPSYRSGLYFSSADNGQGINVYDGTNDNIIQRNYVAAVYDGIQFEAGNARGNIARGNIVGESPRGEAAPLTGWGVVVRWSTTHDTVSGNTIRNAAKGGIGLLRTNNTGAAQAPAYNIRITRNIVTDTNGPAIDLFGSAGADPNDPGDTDSGANTLLNSPVVTSATTEVVKGTAVKGATVEIFRASRAAGAYGLPVEFLGDGTVAGDGTWQVQVSGLAAGDRVTALQIRTDDTTSELSANTEVVAAPAAGDLIASDDFERSVAPGWGTADLGGAWTLVGSGFSVSDGAGRLNTAANGTLEARLPVSTADVWVTGRVAFDRIPIGGHAYAYVLARADATNAYRGTIRIASTTGKVFVQLKKVIARVESNVTTEFDTGLFAQPDTFLRYRLEVVGDQLRFKVWDIGAGEPADWQLSATDASLTGKGATGLTTYLGKNTTNGPVTVSLDAFDTRRGS